MTTRIAFALALLLGFVATSMAADGPSMDDAVAALEAPIAVVPTAADTAVVPVPELSTPPETAPADTVAAAPPPVEPRKDTLTDRARHTIAAFASDAWYVVSAPARPTREGLIWTAGILGATAVIYANDQEILDAVVRNRDEPVFGTIIDIGTAIEPAGFMGRTNPIYAVLTAAGYAFDYEPLKQIPVEILESHMIAGGLRGIGKTLIGRRRPHEGGPKEFEFNGGTSFPSGHASVIFEVATILSRHVKSTPFTIGAYALATTMAIQRVEDGQHWPSDVFIPSITGTLIARAVVRRNQERRTDLSFVPWIDPDGRLLGLGVTRSF